MSSKVETPTELVEPQIRPDEDPEGFINQQLEKMKFGSEESLDAAPEPKVIESPNEPGGSQETQSVNWEEVIIPDGTEGVNKFFWGKPLGELNKSYRNAESKIKEQGDELTRLRAQLAGEQTLKQYIEMQQQAASTPRPKPEPSPLDNIDWETDPIVNARKVYEAVEQQIESRVNQRLQEQAERVKYEIRAESNEEARQQAYTSAVWGAKEALNLSDDQMDVLFRPLTEMVLKDQSLGEYRVYDPNAYVTAYSRIRSVFGVPEESAQKAMPPPSAPPEAANPPGAKRVAAGGPTPKGVPTLKGEQSAILDQMAGVLASAGVPFDADQFKSDAAARLAGA